jgi:hypothetical protein
MCNRSSDGKSRLAGALATFSFIAIAGAATTPRFEFRAEEYLKHVRFLASEDLQGRGAGTAGLDIAARYIARQFREAGLQPLSGSFFQEFTLTVRAEMGARNRFRWTSGGQRHQLKPREDYVPFSFSSSSRVECALVFAGYGITAAEYNYDDYAGLDVKDKCVLVLRQEPQEFDEHSVFNGKVYTQHSQFPAKAFNARNRGAKAIVLINNMANRANESDQLVRFGDAAGPSDSGIAYVHMKSGIAEKWIKTAGKDLNDLIAGIDKDLKPRSFAFPDSLRLEIETEIRQVQKKVRNVAGYLPGETEEHIVIGAHYDHLGLGDSQHSLAPSQVGKPHNGADDNASGTSGVIELARYFGSRPKARRGMLFLAFAGEELGLLGSSHYVNHPLLPLSKAITMMNMDMIGRPKEGKVYVGGSATGNNFKPLIEKVAPLVDLKLDYSERSGYGSSDHTSFTTKQIPVLFFFSGLHADYHKPSDTWDKIDSPQAVKVLQLIAGLAEGLAAASDRPQYVKVAEPPKPAGGSSGGGYGPYFGSIPDFAEVPNGVRFADVREGSPAAKAGLRGGDILVEFSGKVIQNLYDYTYALREKRPGDVVVVKVLRDGKAFEVKVTLEQRR